MASLSSIKLGFEFHPSSFTKTSIRNDALLAASIRSRDSPLARLVTEGKPIMLEVQDGARRGTILSVTITMEHIHAAVRQLVLDQLDNKWPRSSQNQTISIYEVARGTSLVFSCENKEYTLDDYKHWLARSSFSPVDAVKTVFKYAKAAPKDKALPETVDDMFRQPTKVGDYIFAEQIIGIVTNVTEKNNIVVKVIKRLDNAGSYKNRWVMKSGCFLNITEKFDTHIALLGVMM